MATIQQKLAESLAVLKQASVEGNVWFIGRLM